MKNKMRMDMNDIGMGETSEMVINGDKLMKEKYSNDLIKMIHLNHNAMLDVF